MPSAPHRKSPNRSRELRERAWAIVAEKLGTSVICVRCGCTFQTNSDLCSADLDERCPGFERIAAAYMAARQEVGLP